MLGIRPTAGLYDPGEPDQPLSMCRPGVQDPSGARQAGGGGSSGAGRRAGQDVETNRRPTGTDRRRAGRDAETNQGLTGTDLRRAGRDAETNRGPTVTDQNPSGNRRGSGAGAGQGGMQKPSGARQEPPRPGTCIAEKIQSGPSACRGLVNSLSCGPRIRTAVDDQWPLSSTNEDRSQRRRPRTRSQHRRPDRLEHQHHGGNRGHRRVVPTPTGERAAI